MCVQCECVCVCVCVCACACVCVCVCVCVCMLYVNCECVLRPFVLFGPYIQEIKAHYNGTINGLVSKAS